jgi:outer membrane protein OmpA-like peptidoglycan-associated protein
MKKIIALFLSVFLLSALSAATNYKLKQFPFYSGVNINMFRLSGNGASGSTARFNYGIRMGYNYTPSLAFELSGNYGTARPSDPETSGFSAWTSVSQIMPNARTETYNIDLAMRYNLLPQNVSNPYIYGGLGNMNWQVENPDDEVSGFDYEKKYSNLYGFLGIGLENRISQHVSINLNYKHSLIFGDTDNILGDQEAPRQISQFGLGLILKFGRGVIEYVKLEDIEAVTFEFNSIKITRESEPIIDYIVEALKQNPDLVLEIRGFTDNTGSDAVNLRMSKKRAMSVKQLLVDQGIAPTRLITTAMGHQNPVATNSTPEGRALNRRVEFYELDK